MAYFNQTLFKEQVAAQAKDKPVFMDVAFGQATELFEVEKQKLISEFNNHPVTKEIEAGPDIEDNPSNTLNGKGNLYSFIGFPRSTEPTKEIKEILQDELKLNKISRGAIYKGNKIRYRFPILAPTTPEIEQISTLPWETGKSWITGIEKGISGLGHYIFKRFFSNSRSLTGLQIKGEVSSASFKTQPYLLSMIKNFINKFR